ncbi:MAG TPA: glycosyltransferase family 39 protein [Rhizomicrobium sp.]|jgi:4-amino-4-deoxy-L-arabinose transferase-like glycosyltransferase
MDDRSNFRIALAAIVAITLIRIVVLVVSPLQLYPDEAQYWWWAQTPDWGYFSKPPMIAWVIWLTSHIFGNAEWALRIGSPILHGLTALIVFAIARLAFNSRTGLWSALAYLTTPGVSYSSGLVSTDVPLLLFWALGLYAFLRAADEPGWWWPVVCGVAFGLGLEAKYAMLYFVLGAIVAAVLVPRVRSLVFGVRGAAILVIGLLLLLPNVLWNAAHGFPTVAHTESNADWSHAHYSLINTVEFLIGQFGVMGPFLFAGLLLALWRLWRRPAPSELLLAAFCAPALVLITVQSFISDANANWAATAYVAGVPLAVATLLSLWQSRALWASFALDGLAMAVLWIVLVWPAFADHIGLGNAFKREEGWSVLGQAVVAQTHAAQYDNIVAANRSIMAELLYYARSSATPLKMWDRDLRIGDHFQMTMRLAPSRRRFLVVINHQEVPEVLPTFDSVTAIDEVRAPLGAHRTRTTLLYDARTYLGPQTP